MPRLVKHLFNNRSVIFDKGKFDEWCVYVVEQNGFKKAPLDETYFTELQQIAQKYADDKVYHDFVMIYDGTTGILDKRILDMIDHLTETYYTEDRIQIEQWFTVLYAGMIAEENKKNAILKKRIKRLGMHQILMLDIPAAVAAKYSVGKKWRDLDAIMKSLGF